MHKLYKRKKWFIGLNIYKNINNNVLIDKKIIKITKLSKGKVLSFF